jgi:integrase
LPRTHLRRRRQTVFFRRIIPHDLRQRFGQREILRSLGQATPGEARRMAQRLWDGTETLFTLVRFNRSLTRADIARLAEQYLDSESLKHEGLITAIGHYPKIDDLPGVDSAMLEDGIADGSDFVGDCPRGTLNDPAEWEFLYQCRLDGLKRDRSLNKFTSVRSAAQELALRNEIDLDTPTQEYALCRALLDAEITIAEQKLAYLRDVVRPHHPLHAVAHRPIVPNPPTRSDAPTKKMAHQSERLFSEIWTAYSDDRVRHNEWKEAIARQAQSTGRLFVEICGDKPLEAYGPADAAEFRRALLSLPGKYDKCVEWRDIQRRSGIRGLIEHCNGKADIDRLKPQTFNRHLAALSGIWPWAQVNEVVPKGTPSIFDGLHINMSRVRGRHHSARDERPAWNSDELAAVLNADLFFGIRSRRSWKKPGPHVLRDERYWGILIGCHSGMRRGEIFQLRVRHVVRHKETGIWHFNLKDPTLDLKAGGSARWVPLHQNLLSLGLIEALVEGREENELLLPEGEAGAEKTDTLNDGENSPYGSAFGKWFQRFKSYHGVRADVTFHSFRHSATTLIINAGAQPNFVEEVIGHESKTRRSEMERYYKGQALIKLKDVIDRLILPINIEKMTEAARTGEPHRVSDTRRQLTA